MSPELRGATFVATGVLLGTLVTSLLTGDGSTTTRPAVAPTAQVSDELLQAVARLEQAITGLASREAPASAPSRQPSPETGEAVVEDANSLIERLEQAVAALSSAGPVANPSTVSPGLRTRPIDRVAVQQTLELLGSDDDSIVQESRYSMLLGTHSDVLRRFGRPTRVYPNQNGGESWEYLFGDQNLTVFFSPQGHVVELNN